MNPLKTIVFFLFVTSFSFSQTETVQDTLLASQYFKKADSLLKNKKYDESIELFDKALPIYEKAQAWERVAGCYNKISKNQKRKYKFKEAVISVKKALEILIKLDPQERLEIAHNYSDIASLYFHLSDYKKAIEFNEKSLTIRIEDLGSNHSKVAQNYNNIGLIYYEKKEYEKAIDYYNKSLTIWINTYGETHRYVGYAYLNIGTSYYDLFQNDTALENIKKALNIFIKIDNPTLIAYANNNIGTIFLEKEEYSEALNYYEKALSGYNRSYLENRTSIAVLFHNMGVIKENQKAYNKALEYHKKALDINLITLGDNHRSVAGSYSYLGTSYIKKGDNNTALINYQKSLKILQDITGEENQIVLQNHINISKVYLKQKEYKKALSHYNDALYINSKFRKNFFDQDKFDPSEYWNSNMLLFTLEGKAEILKQRYIENNDTQDLSLSLKLFKRTDVTVDFIRQSFNNYKDKISFAKKVKEIYSNAIESQLLFFKEKQEQQILEKAFYYAEKSKSNTLKDLLNDSNAKIFSGLSTDLVKLEKDLRIDKAYYQSKLNGELVKKEIDSSKFFSYENKLFDISRNQDSLTEVLEKNYPKYYELKYQNEVISVAEILKKLDDNTTLLEFFTSDSIIYAFTVSKNKMAVKELSTPKLTEQIQELRAAIVDKNTKTYKATAHQLYEQLMAPVKDAIIGDELIIVPDGPLWHLNFDLLLSKEDASNNPKELSYLVKEYMISYANSATLLFSEDKNLEERSKQQEECLAFSFSDSSNVMDTKTMSLATLRDTGDDLPGTRKEIKAIADIIDGEYFYGSEAIESNFKKNASNYSILHLALHGEVDNERPENSRLFFTKNNDTIEDNLLYSHELFALDIPAELTVLSACNTGTGKIAKGEGIMSLGTAFQYAGTKSLLLSSWEVSDQTTPELMKYFYTNLKEGMNKAKALQQAKLQYLNTSDLNRTQPFYWGGFYLVGDTTAIQFQDNNYIYWLIGFGILAVIILSLFWYRKKSSPLETCTEPSRSRG
ncbi:CHAT domain-containing protein [uncultured Aquimarina sp.]|uniref:CHAT domain-containing protein n=1 Tax=uncultured Aquimarina sp. TaxID=575652 RepID=UPI00260A8229|nr:CHAT domain-containing protein [uncultured Aquimarina sp.]